MKDQNKMIKWTIILFVILALVAVLSSNGRACDSDEEMTRILEAAGGAAERYDIPVELVLAVIETESSYDPEADNGTCKGLMQIHKINHEWLNSEFGRTLDMFDIEDNVYAGSYILAGFYHEHDDIHEALMHYNGGKGYLNKMKRKGIKSTKYTRKIVGIMEEIETDENYYS